MVFHYRSILKYQVFRAYFHRQYEQVRIHTGGSQLLTCDCQNYSSRLNQSLPNEFKLDVDSPLPSKVPSYKKHALVLSLQNKSADELEWMTNWQSKLELNPMWPYSIIGDLKTHLKHTKFGSDVLVNAISIHSGNLSAPSRDPHERAHIFVIPDMKLYKISPQDVVSFAHFLGGGHTRQVADHQLSFADFLKGADNVVNKTELVSEPSNADHAFPHEDCKRDWILVCGHNQRDRRCGILGKELINEISAKGLDKDKNVALISHVGGHKFAGNLILYNYVGTNEKTGENQLDSLWFSRVLPPNLGTLLEHSTTVGEHL
ncbi:altered inheritance of mitochondria protein 32 [Zygosaccharomyces rouxii]|nr:altered inheritance of mitochondria protein 32 [Zygosaccharomyces rouxii]